MIGDFLISIWLSDPLTISLIVLAWLLGALAVVAVSPLGSVLPSFDWSLEPVVRALRVRVSRLPWLKARLAQLDVPPAPTELPAPATVPEPASAESNVVRLDKYRKAS